MKHVPLVNSLPSEIQGNQSLTLTDSREGGTGSVGAGVSPAPASTVTLPLPVSANRIWRRYGKRIVKNPDYVKWQTLAGQLINVERRLGNLHSHTGPYDMAVILPLKTRCDADNYVKGLSDTLQKFGVVSNDKLLRNLTLSRGDVPAKHCTITVSDI